MRNNNVKYLTLTAVYAAVIYIFTAYLHIPHWTGYVHVGDGVLYLASSMLPPCMQRRRVRSAPGRRISCRDMRSGRLER